MKKVLCIIAAVLLLSGCGDNTSYNYYSLHPGVTKDKLESCRKADDSTSESCVNAIKAGQLIAGFVRTMQQNQNTFGQEIIRRQQQLVKAKQELTTASSDEKQQLEEKIKQLRLEIDQRLAIIGLLESPQA